MKKTTLLWLTMSLTACSTHSVKEKINQAGDAAGQVAGEFIEGASKGVEKAFDVRVELHPALAARGIELGKTTVSNDSTGTDNRLTVYMIFNQPIQDTLMAKAYDGETEMGRARAVVNGKQNDAAFIEFHFDARTNLDSKNRLTLE